MEVRLNLFSSFYAVSFRPVFFLKDSEISFLNYKNWYFHVIWCPLISISWIYIYVTDNWCLIGNLLFENLSLYVNCLCSSGKINIVTSQWMIMFIAYTVQSSSLQVNWMSYECWQAQHLRMWPVQFTKWHRLLMNTITARTWM